MFCCYQSKPLDADAVLFRPRSHLAKAPGFQKVSYLQRVVGAYHTLTVVHTF